jgi:hypothetical protein
MINLSGVTKIMSDIEILEAVADKVNNSLKEEPVPEDVIDSILKLLGPYRILSLSTGWPEDSIKGYLRQAVRERKLKKTGQ